VKATGEIGQQVSGIEAATQDSVGAIQEISGTIEKLSEISTVIAAAVEEQVRGNAGNLPERATGGQRHAAGLRQHQRRAALSDRNRDGLFAAAAQSLSRDSNRLKLEVGNFLESVRAA
jgi:methyl-accepting chemotaxis protein